MPYFGCTGSVSACASVEIGTSWNGASTNVVVRMRNWSTPWTDPSTLRAYAIQGFRIYSEDIVSGGTGTYGFATGWSTSGDVEGRGMEPSWHSEFTNYTGSNSLWFHGSSGILGCNVTGWEGRFLGSFSTCSQGESWAIFSFSTIDRWDVAASPSSVMLLADYNQGSCSPVDNPYAECIGLHVVPEPITVVLVGSGLAGIGALRARRRKDQVR